MEGCAQENWFKAKTNRQQYSFSLEQLRLLRFVRANIYSVRRKTILLNWKTKCSVICFDCSRDLERLASPAHQQKFQIPAIERIQVTSGTWTVGTGTGGSRDQVMVQRCAGGIHLGKSWLSAVSGGTGGRPPVSSSLFPHSSLVSPLRAVLTTDPLWPC